MIASERRVTKINIPAPKRDGEPSEIIIVQLKPKAASAILFFSMYSPADRQRGLMCGLDAEFRSQ